MDHIWKYKLFWEDWVVYSIEIKSRIQDIVSIKVQLVLKRQLFIPYCFTASFTWNQGKSLRLAVARLWEGTNYTLTNSNYAIRLNLILHQIINILIKYLYVSQDIKWASLLLRSVVIWFELFWTRFLPISHVTSQI